MVNCKQTLKHIQYIVEYPPCASVKYNEQQTFAWTTTSTFAFVPARAGCPCATYNWILIYISQ